MARADSRGGTRRVKVDPKKKTAPTARSAARPAQKPAQRRTRTEASAKRAVKKPAAGTRAKKMSIKEKLVRTGEMDYMLLFMVILIVAVGAIIMLSASAPSGSRIYGDPYYYFKRQMLFIVMGFAGMFIVSRINLESLHKYIPKAFGICVLLLVLVLIPGIGVESHGARRWLNIPFIQLQPSELMKPMIAMFIAYLVKIGVLDLRTFRSNLMCAVFIGLVAFLLMLETHLSGTIVIVGIAVCVMLAGGTPIKPMIIGGMIMAVLVIIYLQFDTVRMARVTALIDPFADPQNTGYQISQSIYAIGSGRWFGLGLGQSVQKYSNLPEPYNDFIFAIVCEELGFFGAVVVILLFAALIAKAMRIAMNAPDVWSSLTCIGIAAQLGIQTFLNMGVAVSLIPNTGVSLPFFSYGGTSIFTLLLEMGVLLNVSRKSVKS